MREDLTEQLKASYPNLFGDRFYFEHDDGWYDLLDNTFALINHRSQRDIYDLERFGRLKMVWNRIIWNNIFYRLATAFNSKFYYTVDKYTRFDIRYDKYPNSFKPKVLQCKEKFGGLRIYLSTTDEYTDGIIDLAERMSYEICEKCGSTHNVSQTSGWIKTLCEECKFTRNGHA